LPGKALLPLGKQPLFLQQVKRVQAATSSGTIIVATTTNLDDDVIERICNNNNIKYFRGHETDLLDRHYKAALKYNADIVVKIPSDCPLIDPAIIDEVINFFITNQQQYDFVSNLHPATWPDGNDVEVMSFKGLEDAWENASKSYEREHTTPYIWDNPSAFRIGNVEWNSQKDFSMSHRFTIDYPEDYLFIKAVFNALHPRNPLFSCDEILELLESRNDIFKINQQYAGVNWYRHHTNDLNTVSISQTKNIEAII
jgi:spore coat polysaccharide biosynthesis protein SpsF